MTKEIAKKMNMILPTPQTHTSDLIFNQNSEKEPCPKCQLLIDARTNFGICNLTEDFLAIRLDISMEQYNGLSPDKLNEMIYGVSE